MNLSIKVDVDTYQGMKEGVPNLLEIFGKMKIRASFFIAMGPDNSGKAIKRIFRKGFLNKMLRTKAPSAYGIKTLLYGTLLPAPLIGKNFDALFLEIKNSGHEVGIHGYDHVKWQDELDFMNYNEFKDEFKKAVDEYIRIFKTNPTSSAAPAWKCNEISFSIEDENNLLYHSDTRGEHPYFVKFSSSIFKTLEIPTTLPTLDEIYGLEGFSENNIIPFYLSQLNNDKLNVLTIHAEMEGKWKKELFEEFLKKTSELNCNFITLEKTAGKLMASKENIPVCEASQSVILGRSGKVFCQKP